MNRTHQSTATATAAMDQNSKPAAGWSRRLGILFLLLALLAAAVPQLSASAAPTDLRAQALAKLTPAEASALLAPFAATSLAYRSLSSSSQPGLDDVMRSYWGLLAELRRPLKWLGADGTEYDTHAEYLQGEHGEDCPIMPEACNPPPF